VQSLSVSSVFDRWYDLSRHEDVTEEVVLDDLPDCEAEKRDIHALIAAHA
jgi:hypothetical protein